VYALVLSKETHDNLLTEAIKQKVAGTEEHNWLFDAQVSAVLGDREFKKGDELLSAYRGVGMLKPSGGVAGRIPYDSFKTKMEELAKNDDDMEYLYSLFPKHDHPNYTVPLDDFLSPLKEGLAPFLYDAAIAVGLAACSVAAGGELKLDGQDHFDHLVETNFTGVTGNVIFDNTTGSRVADNVLYTVVNFVDENVTVDGAMVRFKEVVTHIFEEGNWTKLVDYTFNDGTTNLPNALPAAVVNVNSLHIGVRASALTLCSIAIALAIGFAVWT
jgi:hypothetical protein